MSFRLHNQNAFLDKEKPFFWSNESQQPTSQITKIFVFEVENDAIVNTCFPNLFSLFSQPLLILETRLKSIWKILTSVGIPQQMHTSKTNLIYIYIILNKLQ